MNKCKEKKAEEQMLNKEFQEAYLIFKNNPQENQATLNALRERIEKLYEEKVEGIIVRSRRAGMSMVKRTLNIFFNLEKRNHIKKAYSETLSEWSDYN